MTPYTQQTEIQFFWPLTEQMPLSLDYAGCDIPKLYTYTPYSHMSNLAFNGSNASWTTSININSDNIIIRSKNKQPLYRRILYKLLGIKWEQS